MAVDRDGNPHRVIVLLDTNALMMPSQFRIDLFEELRELLGSYEPVVLAEVVNELMRLSAGHGKDAAAARLGLEMSRKCTIVESGSDEGTVDETDFSLCRTTQGYGADKRPRTPEPVAHSKNSGNITKKSEKTRCNKEIMDYVLQDEA